MSGMAFDDSPAQVNVEGDVSEKKVEVQDQNEVGGMPSRQEEILSYGLAWCICQQDLQFSTLLNRQVQQTNTEKGWPG
ncbi:uncharacterized protein [Zea mays]|uniref:uncharacterized protein n=1 Tax=Zea mays TaxID=4577 RepID=UPI0009AA4B2B|nr:uncharacterized protein LOC109943457 [Zea mays]|eukprot:XP_020402101.1 uncharacterized protein LOC109943457 [Zea mays]